MTDKQVLYKHRINQAFETLSDAQKMLAGQFSKRSVINRAYYAVFYSLLALFIKTDVNIATSKHAGVIALFDKEFIHTGKIEKSYSKAVHKLFDTRQEVDYKELAEVSHEEAAELVNSAEHFLEAVKDYS